jgi:hypothetical protein
VEGEERALGLAFAGTKSGCRPAGHSVLQVRAASACRLLVCVRLVGMRVCVCLRRPFCSADGCCRGGPEPRSVALVPLQRLGPWCQPPQVRVASLTTHALASGRGVGWCGWRDGLAVHPLPPPSHRVGIPPPGNARVACLLAWSPQCLAQRLTQWPHPIQHIPAHRGAWFAVPHTT